MRSALRKAAIEQADLLVAYLSETPAAGLDLNFVQTHLDALRDYASAAAADTWHEKDDAPERPKTAH